MSQALRNEYIKRFNRVLDRIAEDGDERLDLDTLCRAAALSKHHFTRQFLALLGLTPHRYVLLFRLKRCASNLAFRQRMPVAQIALDCGFESQATFTRAFKQALGVTPGAFRRRPDWRAFASIVGMIDEARSRVMTEVDKGHEVRIVDFPETPVAMLTHQGDPTLLGETIRKFIAWRKSAGLSPRNSATFNLLYGDPDETDPADFRLDLCAATSLPVADNDAGVVSARIPAGRCAVLRHTDGDLTLKRAFDFLYGVWLPNSGHEPRDFPPFLQRISFYPDVPENQAVCDIFLPLQG